MDKATHPLLHMLSWCTQVQLCLHITLTPRHLDYTLMVRQATVAV